MIHRKVEHQSGPMTHKDEETRNTGTSLRNSTWKRRRRSRNTTWDTSGEADTRYSKRTKKSSNKTYRRHAQRERKKRENRNKKEKQNMQGKDDRNEITNIQHLVSELEKNICR